LAIISNSRARPEIGKSGANVTERSAARRLRADIDQISSERSPITANARASLAIAPHIFGPSMQ